MGDGLGRWRTPILLVAIVIASVAVLIVVLRPGQSPALSPSPSVAASSTAPTTAVQWTAGPSSIDASAAPANSIKGATAWPVPKDIPGLHVKWNPADGDPFESEAGRPGDVRVLVTVGAFKLGVTLDSKVHDEGKVIVLLREMGTEIDTLDKGRTDSYEKRVVEYQEVINRYRPKLREHMEGAFAMKGNGWTDTERVIPPPLAGSDAS